MEAVCTSETLVYFYETTRRYIPEGRRWEPETSQNLTYLKHEIFCKKRKLSRYAMQAPRERGVYSSYSFLTSALEQVKWLSSRPDRALRPGKAHRHQLDRRLCGLDTQARGKILCLCRGSNPGRPVCIVRLVTDWATPAPKSFCGDRKIKHSDKDVFTLSLNTR
jgi:hypothetical protein